MTGNRLRTVGSRPIRHDGVDKVTGRANFGADVDWPGMLQGRVLRSPHAHARIRSVDVSRAVALDGVHGVITGGDLPALESIPEYDAGGVVNLRHVAENVLARDRVLYHGHAVAAVAAESAAIADAALELIEVSYEPLPAVLDVEQAMSDQAPVLHPGHSVGDEGRVASNVASRTVVERGDVDGAWDAADVVVSGSFRTAAVHQAYIEPHAAAARVGEDGQVVLWCTTQGPFMVRDVSAAILDRSPGDIRVIPSEIGGGFGGKTTVYLEPLAVRLAEATHRPVRLVMQRDEVFRATGPAPAGRIEARIGARHDGTLVAAEAELTFEAGAFPGSPVGAAAMTMFAPYRIEHVHVEGLDVVVNKPKVAAYRAPGAPISAFAAESLLDDLARELDMDPIDLRLHNAVIEGDKAAHGAVFETIGLRETLEVAQREVSRAPALGSKQGRGVASGYWFNAGLQSTATVNIAADGSAIVVTGSPDIGGSRASLAMMAAEELGIDVHRVHPVLGDTQTIGFNDQTGGSRVTYATGMAVVEASRQVVSQLRARAAILFGVDVDAVAWSEGRATLADAQGSESLSLEELAKDAGSTGGPFSATVSLDAKGAGPGFATHVCDVEVDEDLGSVRIVRYLAVQDAGRAIHPSYVEGQMQGAVAQGIGWALNEEYVWNEEGELDNPSFLDYRIPVASDLPSIATAIVEVPNPHHPYGVRGVGEVGIVPPLAAVANAIRDAVGVRPTELPISPPRLRALLEGRT
ncbi:MAG: xanthine dehydrogenase family protein molybdopterin-binding subunit [Nitriliruptor sp.]|nr:MAG: xanthine dehydrogenase family protein molybdopterin-binding subunit [Nitriliruptor sp.]